MPLYPFKVLRARERAPTLCPSIVFNLKSHLSALKNLGVHHQLSLGMVKPLPSHLTRSPKLFALVVKIYVYFNLLGHVTLIQIII
jgi:hypothetical protein